MNHVKLPAFVLSFLLLAGTLFLSACSEALVGEETPSVQELEGSVGEPVVITAGKTASNATVDFDDLLPFELVVADRYAAQGVEVKIGPGSGGTVRGSPGSGPCDGTPALLTLPQTGPSILFNFNPPVSFVSIDAGDFGQDSDVMTLTAYSDVDAGGAVVGTDAQTLPLNHATGCLGLSVSAAGIRSVAITSVSPFPNSILVDNLDFVSTPTTIVVDVDIKPSSDPNSINCNNDKGVIAVAILTTDDFDATTVDHTTVVFEGAGETHVDKKSGQPRRHEEDVDGDGNTDLVLHFRQGETALDCGSTEGTLAGETFSGQAIEGADAVRMVEGG